MSRRDRPTSAVARAPDGQMGGFGLSPIGEATDKTPVHRGRLRAENQRLAIEMAKLSTAPHNKVSVIDLPAQESAGR